MAQLRDFLDRFRPAGAPGAAARAGVPADRAREQAAELDPVLALLDDVQAECQQIVARAEREAAGIAEQARADAAAITEAARARASEARQQAMQEVLERARAQAQTPVEAASREASQIRQRAADRLPDLVTRAVARVRAAEAPL